MAMEMILWKNFGNGGNLVQEKGKGLIYTWDTPKAVCYCNERLPLAEVFLRNLLLVWG